MTLAPGVQLGPYQVEAFVGAGGMGEVYRARDTRLNRLVALKILPAHVSNDVGRRERFAREARVISRLNHPHIRGLHDVGAHDGIDFLVMEYLEGETLEIRLSKRPISIAQTLTWSVQIAEALDAAHRQWIAHGDLKPANIMLTGSGAKLLDFGVARLWEDLRSSEPRHATTETDAGGIPGTTAYMAPEQLEGRESDARSDIYSFGVVLYEMLAGRRPFEAPTRARLIAAILEHEPPTVVSPTEVLPAALERAVMKCLSKDPEARWQSVRDLADELTWIAQTPRNGTDRERPVGRRLRPLEGLVAAALAGAIVVGTWWLAAARAEPERSGEGGVVRFVADAPPGSSITVSPGAFAVSPDGRRLAFVASAGNGTRLLWLRSLDSPETRALAGTDEAWNPFWSPDNRSVAFVAGDQLRKIDLSSNRVQTLTTIPGRTAYGAWSANGTIVVSVNSSLLRLPADGGVPTPLTIPEALRGATLTGPEFLPDGSHLLYHARRPAPGRSGIYVTRMGSPDHRWILDSDSQARYAEPGYLLYIKAGGLVAQPFDAQQLEVTGEPRPLPDSISFVSGINRGAFSVSRGNLLAYRGRVTSSELLWIDRAGRPLGSAASPGPYINPALSPDGSRIAITRFDPAAGAADIWLIDANRGLRQLTSAPGVEDFATWAPDGERILFASLGSGGVGLFEKSVNASASDAAEQRLDSPSSIIPFDCSDDGLYLLYSTFEGMGALGARSWALPIARAGHPQRLTGDPPIKEEGQEQISPDGRWVAFVSDVNGSPQIYVAPFPRGRERWLISPTGGFEPKWRGDSRELFYLAPDQTMMSVEIDSKPSFSASEPRPLFRTNLVGAYLGAPFPNARVRNEFAVTPDGQRFLINQPVGGSSAYAVRLIVNWLALLE